MTDFSPAVPSQRASSGTSAPTSIPSVSLVYLAPSWVACFLIPLNSANIIRFARNQRVHTLIQLLPLRQRKRRISGRNLLGDGEIERIFPWMSYKLVVHCSIGKQSSFKSRKITLYRSTIRHVPHANFKCWREITALRLQNWLNYWRMYLEKKSMKLYYYIGS